jgi:hypothetical protein
VTEQELELHVAKTLYDAAVEKARAESAHVAEWEKVSPYWRAIYLRSARAAVAAIVTHSGGSEHVVKITADGWVLRHPITERLYGELFDCEYNDVLSELGPSHFRIPGEYRVRLHFGRLSDRWLEWEWELIE